MVVGSAQRDGVAPDGSSTNNLSLSQVLSTSRTKDAQKQTAKLQRLPPSGVYLSIYKTKVRRLSPTPLCPPLESNARPAG